MVRVLRVQSRICVGGPALHSILLTEGLSHKNGSRYETTLVGGGLEPGEAPMSSFAESRGVAFRTIEEMRRSVDPKKDAQAVAKMVGLIRKVKPDIVHTHTAKAGAIGRLAAKMAGVPIVLHTFHGHVFEGYFSQRKTKFFVNVERGLAKGTTKLLAISNAQRNDLVDKYRIAPDHKVSVVPLGLALERFRALQPKQQGSLRQELGLSDKAQLIGTVGRLVPIKRFDLLIEAFKELSQRNADAHLVIVGDGEEKPALEALAQDNPRIHFTGLRRDLENIYPQLDVFALTSDNEGTPVAVIEALTSGLKVVATDVGGVQDIMDPGMGEIVPPGQVGQISQALERQLSGQEALADLLRDQIYQRFSHQRLISDITQIYDQLIQQHAERTRGGLATLRRWGA